MVALSSLPAEDQRVLVAAPFCLLNHVGNADGTLDDREIAALRNALGATEAEGLAKAILAAAAAEFEQLMQSGAGLPDLDGLRAAALILDTRVEPGEAEAVKEALLTLGEKVAGSTGGFLGIGAHVTSEEKVALREAGRALRLHSRRSLMSGVPSFGSILVPLAGTHHSEAALKPAAEIAERFGARVTVIQVATSFEQLSRMVAIDGFVTPGAVDAIAEAGEAEKRDAQAYLQSVVRAVGGPDWTAEVREGDPATVIAEEAEKAGADLIVMASEKRSVLGRLFDPSVAEHVVRNSKVPVLVVPIGSD